MLNDVCEQRVKENDSAVTLVESSPKGELQSNGIAEQAVQDLEEGVRTHKLDLETKLKMAVRIGHRCTAWLVENVADIINKFKIGKVGSGKVSNDRRSDASRRGVRSHAQVAHDEESRRNQGKWMDAGMKEVQGREGRCRLQSARC